MLWSRIEEAHERSEIGNLVRPDGSVCSARRLVAELADSAGR